MCVVVYCCYCYFAFVVIGYRLLLCYLCTLSLVAFVVVGVCPLLLDCV